jgi:O-acetyl-ADP-ribose deacetylase (regulator of RNase III)
MSGTLKDRLVLERGDITTFAVDAIVNAANTSLLGGGGVDGAIHRAAGPDLLAECRKLGGCETGSARITKGYRLPARHVIHAVGPVYRNGKSGEPELLAGCYRTALKLASEHACRTIAFPAISCGVYGYPLSEAAEIALRETASYLRGHSEIRKAIFVLYDRPAYAAYQQVLSRLIDAECE